MARRTAPKPFAPQAYERGAWVTWTDADSVARFGQITDQAPEAGTWWLTSATADDRIETYLLRRLPVRTHRERNERDERVARGGDSHLYEVRALAYARNDRAEVYAVAGDHLAPAVACDEPRAESLARNGQTLLPLDVDDVPAEQTPTAPVTEGTNTVALVSQPRTPSVAIARALRALGLKQGSGGDFRTAGYYVGKERRHTYVILLNRAAEKTVAANADRIEQAPELGGFAFTVSVRYVDGRVFTSVSNGGGERIRETAPSEVVEEGQAAEETPAAIEATETPDEADEDVPAAEETPEGTEGTEVPAVDWREAWRREEQAQALDWSTKHAEVVGWAVAGELVRDTDGTPRRVTRPGRAGARVNADRTAVLEAAGYLVTVPAADGPGRVEVTADGRRALLVWQTEAPAPVERTRKRERLPLRPLLYGELWTRQRDEFRVDEERRRVKRERFFAELEERWAEEDREARRWRVWALVEDVNPVATWRKRPRGWAPSDEDVLRYRLDPEVVAELRAEAAEVAAGQAPAEVEQDLPAPHDRTLPPRTATPPTDVPPGEVTCVLSTHTLYSVGQYEPGGTHHDDRRPHRRRPQRPHPRRRPPRPGRPAPRGGRPPRDGRSPAHRRRVDRGARPGDRRRELHPGHGRALPGPRAGHRGRGPGRRGRRRGVLLRDRPDHRHPPRGRPPRCREPPARPPGARPPRPDQHRPREPPQQQQRRRPPRRPGRPRHPSRQAHPPPQDRRLTLPAGPLHGARPPLVTPRHGARTPS
ncbi:hypothetical protein [Streptomyces canus]|uniref:hypothetical protein n=1 Tax=Streptomyces canus TaxID=58343 RepID=UPI002E26CB8C